LNIFFKVWSKKKKGTLLSVVGDEIKQQVLTLESEGDHLDLQLKTLETQQWQRHQGVDQYAIELQSENKGLKVVVNAMSEKLVSDFEACQQLGYGCEQLI